MNGISFAPVRASTSAVQIDSVFLFELGVSAFFVIAIFTTIIYFVIRYARRSEDEIPPVLPPHYSIEALWTIGPFILMLGMFCWGAFIYIDVKKPLEHGLEVHIIGKQWMWKIEHPDGVREINELHVPIGLPVKLILTSQDVIHDFAIPEFRIKQDVLPGCYVTEWFTATRPGRYHIFCSQYCGTDHARMVGWVTVMNEADYAAWRAGVQPAESPASTGQKLFTSYGCASCHGQRAPSLAGIYNSKVLLEDGSVVTADENYLRKSILDPTSQIVAGYPPIMPAFQGQISEEQIIDLIAYIKSLSTVRNTTLPATLPGKMPFPQTQPAPADQPQTPTNYPPAERPAPPGPSPIRSFD